MVVAAEADTERIAGARGDPTEPGDEASEGMSGEGKDGESRALSVSYSSSGVDAMLTAGWS
jgi:hypothetical protein